MENNQMNYCISPPSPDYSRMTNSDSKDPEPDLQESKEEDKKPLPKFVMGTSYASRSGSDISDTFKLKRNLKKTKKQSMLPSKHKKDFDPFCVSCCVCFCPCCLLYRGFATFSSLFFRT